MAFEGFYLCLIEGRLSGLMTAVDNDRNEHAKRTLLPIGFGTIFNVKAWQLGNLRCHRFQGHVAVSFGNGARCLPLDGVKYSRRNSGLHADRFEPMAPSVVGRHITIRHHGSAELGKTAFQALKNTQSFRHGRPSGTSDPRQSWLRMPENPFQPTGHPEARHGLRLFSRYPLRGLCGSPTFPAAEKRPLA